MHTSVHNYNTTTAVRICNSVTSVSPIDDEFVFKMITSSLRTPNYSITEEAIPKRDPTLIDREADNSL
jgi:hypothetical protein